MLKSVLLSLALAAAAGEVAAHPPSADGARQHGQVTPPLTVPRAKLPSAPAVTAPASAPLSPVALPADAPPTAKPGECYARIRMPARTERYQEQVVVEPERIEERPTPPRFETRSREVILTPEQRRTVVTPPLYETRTEQVLVVPGFEERVVEPAKLATVAERVTIAPPRLVWKAVSSPLQPAPVWCLVEEPALAETHARTVVVEPERTRVIAHPPRYETVSRQVLTRPAETRDVVTPAVTRTEVFDELVEPPRTEPVRVPARLATVTKTRVVTPERSEWTLVLCEAQATPERIRAIQAALAKRGFYRGKVDGLYGPVTADAVTRFQRDGGLPHAGYLSLATLARLGVAVN